MYAAVNGTRIFFDVDGPGVVWRDGTDGVERPPMLMLPGGPAASHMHYKSPQHRFDLLKDAFQLIYVDWRGASRSDPAPSETLTLDNAVEDVEALRRQLGVETWTVLGASAGGAWALAYAARYPERVQRLIAMHCPSRWDGWADLAEGNARRAGVTDADALRLYRGFAAGELTTPVEEWAWSVRNTIIRTQQATYIDAEKHPEAIEEHQRRWDSLPDKELLAELDVSRWYLRDFGHSYPTPDICRRITSPTLIVTGETDPVAPPEQARETHAAISGSELYIHSGGHMPLEDEQGPFLDRIADFLARNGVDAGALAALRA
jgi:proline iminopeptidase